MKILYIPSCGFGDVSFSTAWPRIFSERGHIVDVFLMLYTGNPFHANPYIKNMFCVEYREAADKIKQIIKDHSYDKILLPRTTCGGVKEVIDAIKDFDNVCIFTPREGLPDFYIPPYMKPEWYFTESERKSMERFKGYTVFHPLSSDYSNISRSISFDLLEECGTYINNMIAIQGGRIHLPIDNLKKLETKIELLWENYNCFNDKDGRPLGKFLALTSMCRASVHGWSGSFTMSMGYNKPYVVVVPKDQIRNNLSAPYKDSYQQFLYQINRARAYGCLNPSAWCITDKAEIIVEALDYIQKEKTVMFNKTWAFL